MARTGRPSVMTDDVRQQLLAAINDGLSVRRAATLVGVGRASIDRAAAKDPLFRAALKKADAGFEVSHLRRIAKGESGWQSSAWLLERKYKERWGRDPVPKPAKPHAYTEPDPGETVAIPDGAVPPVPSDAD